MTERIAELGSNSKRLPGANGIELDVARRVRSEESIPNGESPAEISVVVSGVRGMVQAVKGRGNNQRSYRPIVPSDASVLDLTEKGVEQGESSEGHNVAAEQKKYGECFDVPHKLLERMEAERHHGVQFGGGMVDLVELPQDRDDMQRAMRPVGEEIHDHERNDELRDGWHAGEGMQGIAATNGVGEDTDRRPGNEQIVQLGYVKEPVQPVSVDAAAPRRQHSQAGIAPSSNQRFTDQHGDRQEDVKLRVRVDNPHLEEFTT